MFSVGVPLPTKQIRRLNARISDFWHEGVTCIAMGFSRSLVLEKRMHNPISFWLTGVPRLEKVSGGFYALMLVLRVNPTTDTGKDYVGAKRVGLASQSFVLWHDAIVFGFVHGHRYAGDGSALDDGDHARLNLNPKFLVYSLEFSIARRTLAHAKISRPMREFGPIQNLVPLTGQFRGLPLFHDIASDAQNWGTGVRAAFIKVSFNLNDHVTASGKNSPRNPLQA
jgi:hypothetical protein